MTTIKKEFIKQKDHFAYIQNKVEEGCRLFDEDMPTEAEIAFSEAIQYSEELVEAHLGEERFLITLAETHHLIALGFSQAEAHEKARTQIEKAFAIYKNIPSIGRSYEPVLASSSARIEKAAGNNGKARKILSRLLKSIDNKEFNDLNQDSFIYCSNLIMLAEIAFEEGQYSKAIKIIQRLSVLKKSHKESYLNNFPQEYIDLLNMASFQSLEHDDENFHQFSLEEGLEACRQAEASKKKIHLLCYGTFYQDMLKLLFFNDDREKLKKTYQEMIAFCERNLKEEPKLLKYKICGQLNYAVFCTKIGESKEAEDVVCDAISGCSEMEDDNTPELTLFMVSALNILSNLQWEKGEKQGALRDLSSECKILSDYLDNHPELSSSMLPLLIDLQLNQGLLLHELGEGAQVEQLIETIKRSYKPKDEDIPQPSLACYLMVLKKIADFHWAIDEYETAKKEYQESLYYLKILADTIPEIADSIKDVEEEIRSRVFNFNNL